MKLDDDKVITHRVMDWYTFWDDIKDDVEAYNKANPKNPMKYDLAPVSDNSFLLEIIPTIIMVVIFIGAWICFSKS